MYRLKNLSGFPLDVPTLSGPVVLPANGEIIAKLGVLDAEVMRQSPYVEITAAEGDGKKRSSKPRKGKKPIDPALVKLRADYTELMGKKPFGGWDAAELQKRIDAKLAE